MPAPVPGYSVRERFSMGVFVFAMYIAWYSFILLAIAGLVSLFFPPFRSVFAHYWWVGIALGALGAILLPIFSGMKKPEKVSAVNTAKKEVEPPADKYRHAA